MQSVHWIRKTKRSKLGTTGRPYPDRPNGTIGDKVGHDLEVYLILKTKPRFLESKRTFPDAIKMVKIHTIHAQCMLFS